MTFEDVADFIDKEDNQLSDDAQTTIAKYTRYGRPYLVSSGYEDGVTFIFTMPPIMSDVLCAANFMQFDITYDECTDYPYIFNAIAFNKITMDWMAVGRLRLNKQPADAYAIAFKKIFSKCSGSNSSFVVGETLIGVVTDWSDAEINGLKLDVVRTLQKNY